MRKLVRDNIPLFILRREGRYPQTIQVSGEEYEEFLRDKLKEEVKEYLRDRNVEELADIYEALVALAATEGYSEEELYDVAIGKRTARGGFGDGKTGVVLLESSHSYETRSSELSPPADYQG